MFKPGIQFAIAAVALGSAIGNWMDVRTPAFASEPTDRMIEFTQPSFNLGVDRSPSDLENIQHKWVEFTVEESDEAIARFGCDDPFCINALREQRGLPPLQLEVDSGPPETESN